VARADTKAFLPALYAGKAARARSDNAALIEEGYRTPPMSRFTSGETTNTAAPTTTP